MSPATTETYTYAPPLPPPAPLPIGRRRGVRKRRPGGRTHRRPGAPGHHRRLATPEKSVGRGYAPDGFPTAPRVGPTYGGGCRGHVPKALAARGVGHVGPTCTEGRRSGVRPDRKSVG